MLHNTSFSNYPNSIPNIPNMFPNLQIVFQIFQTCFQIFNIRLHMLNNVEQFDADASNQTFYPQLQHQRRQKWSERDQRVQIQYNPICTGYSPSPIIRDISGYSSSPIIKDQDIPHHPLSRINTITHRLHYPKFSFNRKERRLLRRWKTSRIWRLL